jgi:hypothetical protein
MTKDKTPSSFKIKMDFEPEEPPYSEDFKVKREEKPGRKIPLVSVLIACVIGAVLLAGYMDLKDRISGLQSVGVRQSQNISETLESRFSALSIKQAALEEASAKNILSVQTALTGIRDTLQQNKMLLDQTAAAKADRKEVDQVREGLKKNISDLNAALKNLEESRLATISVQVSKFGDDLKASQVQVKEVEAAVADLSKNQVDRKQIAAQIGASEKKMLEAITRIRSELDAAVKDLEKRIDRVAAVSGPPSSAPLSAGPDKDGADVSAPKPGTVIEENLP